MEKIMMFGLALWVALMMAGSPMSTQPNPSDKPSTPNAKAEYYHSPDKPVKLPVKAEYNHSPDRPNTIPVQAQHWHSAD